MTPLDKYLEEIKLLESSYHSRTMAYKIQKLLRIIEVLRDALQDFALGHEHDKNLPHIRTFGNNYGWCDFCQEEVEFGLGDAEKALIKADDIAEGKE